MKYFHKSNISIFSFLSFSTQESLPLIHKVILVLSMDLWEKALTSKTCFSNVETQQPHGQFARERVQSFKSRNPKIRDKIEIGRIYGNGWKGVTFASHETWNGRKLYLKKLFDE